MILLQEQALVKPCWAPQECLKVAGAGAWMEVLQAVCPHLPVVKVA